MNAVVHFELPYDNAERIARFYRSAFGWKTQVLGAEMGNYVLATTAEQDARRQFTKLHEKAEPDVAGYLPTDGVAIYADLEDTKAGQARKDDPADVAKAGWDAMKDGEATVIHGLKNKMQVAAASMFTDATTAKLHRAQLEPGSGSE